MIADDLAQGTSSGPIELGTTQIGALDELFQNTPPDGSHGLSTLAAAVARYLRS